jgi:molybdopterin molybdotransferase
MLSVETALDRIIEQVHPLAPFDVDLSAAQGLVLAQDVVSNIESPPFDKALMDGYAVRAADLNGDQVTLSVIDEVTAGRVSKKNLGPHEAIRIMTGAPLPEGADLVVRIEETQLPAQGRGVVVQTRRTAPGTNIIRRGTALRFGDLVLPAGRQLRAQELGALAEVGQARVPVVPRPLVGVLATGDELVPVDQEPAPAQIRNSNETMLLAQARRLGCARFPLGIARDDREHLEKKVRAGLRCDVLCLSGGVSAGKLDLVPGVLQACGVEEVFHKVEMKPGKPVWFGVLDESRAADGKRHYIFGLPGNPVSSMVCFELFVRTAIHQLAGIEPARPVPLSARLAVSHHHRDDRPTYFPSRLEWTPGGPQVTPVAWKGSSDLRSTVDANAMVLFPAGERAFAAGQSVDVFPW